FLNSGFISPDSAERLCLQQCLSHPPYPNISCSHAANCLGGELPAALDEVRQRHVSLWTCAHQRTVVALAKHRVRGARSLALGEFHVEAESARSTSAHQRPCNATVANGLAAGQKVLLRETPQH